MIEVTLKNKKMNIQKLIAFGFREQDGRYTYAKVLDDVQMQLTVTVSADGAVSTEVVDCGTDEEYVLHCVPGTSGAFVGMVRTEYQKILDEITAGCFDSDVFQSDHARDVIAYARDRYGDEPEFLWNRFPDNAILRRKDTNKWYAALLTVSERKLGLDSDARIEILDLRGKPEEMESLIDHKNYFPGYHMNKKHWYTIRLNGSVPMTEICRRMDESYQLAAK